MRYVPARLGALTVTAAFAVLASSSQAQTPAADHTVHLTEARSLLEKYKDPLVAIHDGFLSTLACMDVSKDGGDGQLPYKAGGMGVHFFNPNNIGPQPDPAKPQVLIYEPVNGKLNLVAAEWFVPTGLVTARPTLWGQAFDGPMPGHHPIMPEALAHYDLHVWLFKDNPNGVFHATNPTVSCANDPYRLSEDPPRLLAVP